MDNTTPAVLLPSMCTISKYIIFCGNGNKNEENTSLATSLESDLLFVVQDTDLMTKAQPIYENKLQKINNEIVILRQVWLQQPASKLRLI